MVVRCELKIPSLGITVRHHSASLVMPNSYPRDGIFNPHLTTIKDSYNLYLSHAMRKPVNAICEQHLRSLISASVVRYLDSIIALVSISEILSLYLASEAEQPGLSLTWSETPKTGFLATRLI